MQNIKEKDNIAQPYNPEEEEKNVLAYVKKRIEVLKETKKNVLGNIDFTEIMKNADQEYQPRNLNEKPKAGNNVFVQDEVLGLRGSRLVAGVTDSNDWRSTVSEPTLYVKIQTALSILIDQNPTATFKAILEKYEETTDIAKAIWKRGWEVGYAKETVKMFIFDLAKYGWAIGRTYPRIIKRNKEVLDELDTENPENNKYRKTEIIEFNDIIREKLDPYRTWIDDMTNLTDPYSMRDWYFEKDFSKDLFETEFGQYTNIDKIKYGTVVDSGDDTVTSKTANKRDDTITVGFYESKDKDLYTIIVPDQDVVLYYSPLPNDDGRLSCWWTCWTIRDPRTPYGIGLYELIKNNKVMYDRFSNMSIDQLTMAIYPMLFFSGTPQQGDGKITFSPNTIQQKLPGTTIDQVKIQYDGRAPEMIQSLKERMDDNTGITPTLQGEVEGKTLGEIIHAKDSALKRLSVPLKNIAKVLEDEAYLFLSWANQVYSIPELKEFVDLKEMQDFNTEFSKEPSKVEMPLNEGDKIQAQYSPTLDLGIEQNREGNLIESPENRYVETAGRPIKWEGRIIVDVQSIVATSQELDKQRKLELFNLVFPALQAIIQFKTMGDIQGAVDLAKPIVQVLEIQDEEPENWLPVDIVEMLENPEMVKQVMAQKQQEMQAQQQASQPLMTDKASLEAMAKEQPASRPGQIGAQTVVPQNEVSNPMRQSIAQIMKPR
jgi:hypothetical protein